MPPAAIAGLAAPLKYKVNEPWTLRLGGFMQEFYRTRQNSVVAGDEDGFTLKNARLTAIGYGRAGCLELSAYAEASLAPTFSLFDFYVTALLPLDKKKGMVELDAGLVRVPISRQQLIADTRLAFPEKPLLGAIAPDRDIGARVWIRPPQIPQLRVVAGVYNGEGRAPVLQNPNEHMFYAGRVEITPFGDVQPYAESAFFGDYLSLGLSAGRNDVNPANAVDDTQVTLGADLSGAYMGVSGTVEYLQVEHTYKGDSALFPGPSYTARGFDAQLNYMVPFELPPSRESRLELGMRVEQFDRNDKAMIMGPGDPNQGQRVYTAVVSYYVRQHFMKVQAAAYHYTQTESTTATGADATYASDQILMTVTWRVDWWGQKQSP